MASKHQRQIIALATLAQGAPVSITTSSQDDPLAGSFTTYRVEADEAEAVSSSLGDAILECLEVYRTFSEVDPAEDFVTSGETQVKQKSEKSGMYYTISIIHSSLGSASKLETEVIASAYIKGVDMRPEDVIDEVQHSLIEAYKRGYLRIRREKTVVFIPTSEVRQVRLEFDEGRHSADAVKHTCRIF